MQLPNSICAHCLTSPLPPCRHALRSFGWRTQCNQCGVARPDSASVVGSAGGGMRQNVPAKPGGPLC